MNTHPKFAIVRLRPNDDVFALFRLLVQHGYPEVSFVNGLRDETFLSQAPFAHIDSTSAINSISTTDTNSGNGVFGPINLESKSLKDHQRPSRLRSPHSTSGGAGRPLSGLSLIGPGATPILSSLSTLPNSVPLSMRDHQSMHYSLGSGTVFPSMGPSDLCKVLSGPLHLNKSGGGSLNKANGSSTNRLSQHDKHSAVVMSSQKQQNQPLVQQEKQAPRYDGGGIINDRKEPQKKGEKVSPGNTPSSSSSPSMTQLRQRGSRAQTDDPSVYANCQLCQNKIMASRLSNLTNHVRRHASLKQFQCCYCEYTHNEMAKVRLHMLHNHKDKDSQPIDNLSPEMQAQWDYLMEQCFPQYNKEFFTKDLMPSQPSQLTNTRISQVTIPTVTPTLNDLQRQYMKPSVGQKVVAQTDTNPLNATNSQVGNKMKNSSSSGESWNQGELKSYTCIECGEMVGVKHLDAHLRHSHAADCVPYACDECRYENSDQWKVRLHISLKHPEKAADVSVTAKSSATDYMAFVPKFFPDYENAKLNNNNDDDELIASIRKEAAFSSVYLGIGERPSRNMKIPFPCQKSSRLKQKSDQRCHLCEKSLSGRQSVSTLLDHAKRHYHRKQFQCPHCSSYSSSNPEYVQSHMKANHGLSGDPPLDMQNGSLQCALWNVAVRCFPQMAANLTKYRCKRAATRRSKAPNFHQKTTSKNPLTVTCRLCLRSVAKCEMNGHAVGHAPSKPFACIQCPFRSTDYRHLRVHKAKHKFMARKHRLIARPSDHGMRLSYVKYCFG